MSDMRPEQEAQLGPKDHSGNAPEEMREDHPTGAFADMSLQEALDAGIIDPTSIKDPSTIPESMPPIEHTQAPPIEHQEDRILGNKSNKKKLGFVAAGIAIVGLAAASLLGGGDEEDKAVGTPTPTTERQTIPTNDDDEVTTTTESTSNTETGSSTQLGTLDLLAIPTGEEVITAERPNGDEITVYTLGGDTPEEKASSAMSLLACYLTTGSNACLDAFSTNEDVQGSLSAWREQDILPILAADPTNSDLQVVIFDDPTDPANVNEAPDDFGRTIVSLEGGTVYYGRYTSNFGSDEWQHPDTRAAGKLESIIKNMSFYLETDDSGNTSVARFEWDIVSSSPYDN